METVFTFPDLIFPPLLQLELDGIAKTLMDMGTMLVPALEGIQPMLDEIARYQKEAESMVIHLSNSLENNFSGISSPFIFYPAQKISEPTATEKTTPDSVITVQTVEHTAKPHTRRRRKKPLVQLPRNPEWKNLEIKAESEHFLSFYYHQKPRGRYRLEDLKFTQRSPVYRTNVALELLQCIFLMVGKEGRPATTQALMTELKKIEKKNTLAARKKLLSKILREMTGIQDDPIPYHPKFGYRPKFSIRLGVLEHGEMLHRSAGNFNEEIDSSDQDEDLN